MAKRYIIDLTQDEKEALIELTRKGKPGARKVKRANILLLADQGKSEQEIITALHTCRNTVLRTRRKFVNGGLEVALSELPRAGRWLKIDDKVETILTTLAQSQPPDGRKRWTLQFLADRLVTLTHLNSLSYEAVRLAPKKMTLSLGYHRIGAFRRSLALNSSGGWKIFWISMLSLTIRPIRWSVLTNFLINLWKDRDDSSSTRLNFFDELLVVFQTFGVPGDLHQAESNPGGPARRRLSNNLKVDVKVTRRDMKTHLQISRSGRYPGESEWRSILRHWPYPVSVRPKEFKHDARCYLRAEWPTQQRLV